MALKITDPIHSMQQYATKVRDQARLKNLRKRREKTSNFGSNSNNFGQKAPGFLTSQAEDGAEGATGGFGGNRESDE